MSVDGDLLSSYEPVFLNNFVTYQPLGRWIGSFIADFFDFGIFWLDLGVQEVSQRRDLEILTQMGSGRSPDDFKKLRSGTGTIFEK